MRNLLPSLKARIKRSLPVRMKEWITDKHLFSRRVVKFAKGKEHLIGRDIRIPRVKLGRENADWVVADRLMSADSIVYSVGIGEDISFDLALMARYGCGVYGWDPTPLAVNFIASLKTPPPGFVFMPYGLAAQDGAIQFGAQDSGDRSFSVHSQHATRVTLEVRTITSMMKMLNHAHVDLLKMDIEGSEYDVIRKIVEERIVIPQLLVEFHHRWYAHIPVQKTKEHIRMLQRAGYLIFDVAPLGGEISFIHKTALTNGRGIAGPPKLEAK